MKINPKRWESIRTKLSIFLQTSFLSWIALALLIVSVFIPNLLRFTLISLILGYEGFKRWAKNHKRSLHPNLKKSMIGFLVLFVLLGSFFEVRFRYFINHIHHSEQTLSLDFVVLKERSLDSLSALEGLTLGVLSDENSISGTETPLEILKQNDVSVKQKTYSGYEDLILGLVHQDVDVIALPSGYKTTFSSVDELAQVMDQLKTLETAETKQNVVVPSSNPDVLNLVLIGGDNPIVSKSTAGFNYDVIVVYSINFKTHQSVMMSLPRDSYLYTTCSKKKDKITHSGWQGADCLTSTLSEFLGIELTNYMLVDFKGLIKIVDSVGGVWMDVPQAIDEQDENRNFDTMIHIDAGYQRLDGQHALAFLRHRHTLENGALTRSENHEKFMVALMKQVAKPSSLFRIPSLFHALEESVLTNMASKDIYTYYQKGFDLLSLNGLNALLPTVVSVSGHDAMIYTPSFGHNLYYYVLDKDSVKAAQEAFQAIQ